MNESPLAGRFVPDLFKNIFVSGVENDLLNRSTLSGEGTMASNRQNMTESEKKIMGLYWRFETERSEMV